MIDILLLNVPLILQNYVFIHKELCVRESMLHAEWCTRDFGQILNTCTK